MGIFLEIQKKVELKKKLIQMASVALNAICHQSSEKYPTPEKRVKGFKTAKFE